MFPKKQVLTLSVCVAFLLEGKLALHAQTITIPAGYEPDSMAVNVLTNRI